MKKIIIFIIFIGGIITGNVLISNYSGTVLGIIGFGINGAIAGSGASALGQLLSKN